MHDLVVGSNVVVRVQAQTLFGRSPYGVSEPRSIVGMNDILHLGVNIKITIFSVRPGAMLRPRVDKSIIGELVSSLNLTWDPVAFSGGSSQVQYLLEEAYPADFPSWSAVVDHFDGLFYLVGGLVTGNTHWFRTTAQVLLLFDITEG